MSPSKVYKWPPTNSADPGFSKYRNEMVSTFRLKHVTIRQAVRESFFSLDDSMYSYTGLRLQRVR